MTHRAGSAGRIVVFEPSGSGHQLYHVRLIVEAAQAAGIALTLATTEAALADGSAQPLHAVLDPRLTDILLTRPQDGFAAAGRLHPVLREQLVQTRALRAALEAAGPGTFRHVFVPFFDAYMTFPLALRQSPCLGLPMSGILHRTRFHMPAMGIRTTLPWHKRIEGAVFASLLRRRDVGGLFTMDPYLDRYYGGRITFLPDPGAHRPSRTREAVRAELGLDPDRLCVLVHGALDSRKAIGPLLEAMPLLPPGVRSRFCVVLAGRQDATVRAVLAQTLAGTLREAGQLVELDGFLADERVDDLLQASDVAWICYVNSDGNSGVLMKAGMAARPVVTATTGISARIVEEDGIGWQADPHDPSSIAETLAAILREPAKRAAAGAAIQRRFVGHTVARFTGPILERFAAMR